MKRVGYVYKTTNLINKRPYIGKKTSSKVDSNYLGSGLLIKRAINKYGSSAFRLEILAWSKDKEELNQLEKEYIALYRKKLGKHVLYNIAEGGSPGTSHHSKETCKCFCCRYERGEQHKPDCKCAFCLNRRGRKDHKENCQCSRCLHKQGKQRVNCKCLGCKTGRGELHLSDCKCFVCMRKKGQAYSHKFDCMCGSCAKHRNKLRREAVYV